MGPTGKRVADNVRALRDRMPLRELEARLGDLGRPILASGIMKIERAERRVDADDLVALAAALGVNPNRLLMPAQARPLVSADILPSDAGRVGEIGAWEWAKGQWPLMRLKEGQAVGEGDAEVQEFRRAANPPEHTPGDEPVSHAARSLAQLVEVMTDAQRHGLHMSTGTGRTADMAAFRRTKTYRDMMRRYVDAVRRSAQHLLDELDAYEEGV